MQFWETSLLTIDIKNYLCFKFLFCKHTIGCCKNIISQDEAVANQIKCQVITEKQKVTNPKMIYSIGGDNIRQN